jgi:hypothetical protein
VVTPQIRVTCEVCGTRQTKPVGACTVLLAARDGFPALRLIFRCQGCGAGRYHPRNRDDAALMCASGVQLRPEVVDAMELIASAQEAANQTERTTP